jgi:14-3-3 protein epsilon
LLKNEKNHKAVVFYLKMKGDYYRYLAEFQVERAPNKEEVKSAVEAAAAYESAMQMAVSELETTDPIRLGLALN